MPDIAPATAKPLTVREQNKAIVEIAAGSALILAEQYFAMAAESGDIETKGKALDRANKITGLTDDKGASTLPTIIVNFTGSAFNVSAVLPPKVRPLEVVEDVTPRAHTLEAAGGFVDSWANAFEGEDD